MRQLAIVGAAWLAALSCAWPVLAEGFHVIPDVEPGIAVKLYDISGDGSVAVGRSMIAGGFALRWTQSDGNQILGDLIDPPSLSEALAVSKNGEFVVGVGTAFTGVSADYEGFIWTEVSGMESIGTLAAPSPGSFHLLQSLGVSDAGDVVVGYQDLEGGREAFRWTAQDRMVGLGDLPGGTEASAAYAVSADGSLLVGYASSARGREAVYWTQPTGFVPLPDLPGADPSKPANATARETTPDGKVIVGNADGPNGTEAFRWSSETGMVGLGDLPGGAFFSGALDVSDDGNVIVGVSFDASDSKDFIWDPVRGMRPLLDVLIRDFGLTGVRDFVGPGGQPLNVRAISGDGMTIAGGNWIADLHGDILPGDTNFDGAVDLADFGTLKANFGTGQYRNQGDFSADSRVDLTDFGLLKQNVGSTTTAVPEPSGGVLCCMAAAGVVACAAATRRRG